MESDRGVRGVMSQWRPIWGRVVESSISQEDSEKRKTNKGAVR